MNDGISWEIMDGRRSATIQKTNLAFVSRHWGQNLRTSNNFN